VSYIGVGPSNQVFNAPRRQLDGMGITVRFSQNERTDMLIKAALLLGMGYMALTFGYEGITGRKLLPKTRTPAAWEIAN
jgi:hypothetical protein